MVAVDASCIDSDMVDLPETCTGLAAGTSFTFKVLKEYKITGGYTVDIGFICAELVCLSC